MTARVHIDVKQKSIMFINYFIRYVFFFGDNVVDALGNFRNIRTNQRKNTAMGHEKWSFLQYMGLGNTTKNQDLWNV